MSPLNSLTLKMWKMTYYMLYLYCYWPSYGKSYCRRRPYWIFARKKVSPRVAEFYVFVCVSLSNGAKITFGPICFRFSHSTAGLLV